VDIDIDDDDAGCMARGYPEIGARLSPPPMIDLRKMGRGVEEAPPRERSLAVGSAREHGDAPRGESVRDTRCGRIWPDRPHCLSKRSRAGTRLLQRLAAGHVPSSRGHRQEAVTLATMRCAGRISGDVDGRVNWATGRLHDEPDASLLVYWVVVNRSSAWSGTGRSRRGTRKSW